MIQLFFQSRKQPDEATLLGFSPDGKTLASSNADETAIMWALEALKFDALMQRGCDWWREYIEYQDTSPEEQREMCEDI